MLDGSLGRWLVSKAKTILSSGAVVMSLFFSQGSAWAACSGVTVITTTVTGQTNNSWLCNFLVNSPSGKIEATGNFSIGLLNNTSSGKIDGFTVTGTILTNGSSSVGISNNSGTITALTNTGSITASGNASIGIGNSGTITTLTNNGSISGGGQAILSSGVITTLENSGTISSTGYAIRNSGTITTLNNTGTITGGAAGALVNLGVITTLNNKQGATSALRFAVFNPANYNIIIASSTNYGKLEYLNPLPGSVRTTFGISALSTTSSSIINTTLSAVLSGVNANYLANTSGTSNGYTFVLTQTTPTSGIWNLLISACSVCSSSGGSGSSSSSSGSSSGSTSVSTISSGTSVGLSSVGASPVLSGGTLVLLSGDSSSAAFSVTGGSTIQNPTSGSATLSGVFSGLGSLTFAGSGTTVLSGANTYSGGTTVSGGTLSLTGGSPTGTGDVYVASAGTLMGTGTIAGNLSVAGVLKPGNSPGYLAASNNVVMNTGSIYQQDIAGLVQASSATPVGATGYYSLLDIGGQFTINAGATLTPRLSNLFTPSEAGYGSAIYVPALGDRFRMVTATGGISGRFSTLTQPAELASGTQLIAFYNVNDSKSVDLAVAPTSYSTTLTSSTNSAKSVAAVLDQLLGVNKVGAATAAQDSLLYAVAGQTAASLPSFMQLLSGEIHAASVATLPQAAQRVQQAVLARLGDYPMAPQRFNGSAGGSLTSGAITGQNPSGLPTADMSSNPAVNPHAANVTSAAVADGRAWGEIAYQRGERSGNTSGSGFNNNLYQLVFGADTYVDHERGIKLGGGLALSNTTVSMGTSSNGTSTIQQGALFVYGKMPVAENYALDGTASVGLSSTNLARSDITGLSSGFSNKAVSGSDALVSVGFSRPFDYSDVRFTPYARLTYQYVGQAAYHEGSTAAALNIASFSGSAVRGVIGLAAGSLNKAPLKNDKGACSALGTFAVRTA